MLVLYYEAHPYQIYFTVIQYIEFISCLVDRLLCEKVAKKIAENYFEFGRFAGKEHNSNDKL